MIGIGAVVIGRNEGARLHDCLVSLQGQADHVVYVDSGSTDGSPAAARALGAEVVDLDMRMPFTAARARNAGFAALAAANPAASFVQFVDGDCSLQPGWLATAHAFLEAHPEVAVVCGRCRERFPEDSLWNRLIDAEWDTPVGPARACGGNALMRSEAFRGAGGFNPQLIAGEEPELCVRLRKAGWMIWRIDAEMVLHDAAVTRFSQWWTRCRRGGHAAAEGAAMHGAPPERHKVREVRSAILWGLLLPLGILAGAVLVTPLVLLLALLWPLQVLRLWRRGMGLTRAFFLVLAKFPEAQGVLQYRLRHLRDGPVRLIEYK